MAGHSHSSNIKFRKDRVDAKRARAFAKLPRMIAAAARQGGGSLDVATCGPGVFASVQAALAQWAVPPREAAPAYVPATRIDVNEPAVAQRLLRLTDPLEDHEDVQAVFRNQTFPDRVVQELDAGA